MSPKILAIGLAVLCVSVRAADLIPVEDFARYPTHSDLRLSPDGRFCAALRSVDGRNFIEFTELAAGTVQKFDPGRALMSRYASGELRSIFRFRWLGSNRVLVDFVDGSAAFDRDGKRWTPISGPAAAFAAPTLAIAPTLIGNRPGKERLVTRHVIHNFRDDVHVLMHKHPWDGVSISPYPDVINIDTEAGSHETVLANPGDVVEWKADRKGVVRLGVQWKSIEEVNVLYREDEKSPWRVLGALSKNRREPPFFHGFSPDNKSVYVAAGNSGGCRALYRCNLETGQLGEPLLEMPGYDLGSSSAAIWSEQKQAMVAFNYMTDGPHLKCFDEAFSRSMEDVDRLLPNTFNRPVSLSNDDRRILIFSSSDRNPGAYYLYSTDTRKLDPILRTRPWIKPEQMASMNPIAFTARDGLAIHGYLTIPLGQKPRNLPLVVLPHDGPLDVRDEWGFNPLVQMLASRGYAVLQINCRGSAGYGAAFAQKGEREGGRAIQHDIEDATRWAIAKKVADPKRIAIVGTTRFGGYSALFALGENPSLYCCGVTMHGVVDWIEAINNLSGAEAEFFRQNLVLAFGDPKAEEETLKAISPVNFAEKITAPVLFIYQKNDPYALSGCIKKMSAASKKAGGNPEVFYLSEEANMEERMLIEKFKAIEVFLAKNLGSAVAPAAIPPAQ